MVAGAWHVCPVCTVPSEIAAMVQQNVPVTHHIRRRLITDACGSFSIVAQILKSWQIAGGQKGLIMAALSGGTLMHEDCLESIMD